jgi:methylglutamate dehydrogenase subunit D
VFERASALEEAIAMGGRAGSTGATALRMGMRRDWQLVQLGTYGARTEALNATLRATLGVALPVSTSEVLRHGRHRLYRLAADQYWIVTDDAAVPAALARAVPADIASLTVLSHARVRIALQGSAAVALLGKLVSVDLRPQSFAVGRFAQTGLHHVGVLLERLGADSFELYVLRTYATSTWEWMIDAALPFGYEVFSA